MRRALWLAMVGIGLACGGGEDAAEGVQTPVDPAQEEANRPPYVEAIAITPAEPTVEDALTAGLQVLDPDRDELSIDLIWYRNGTIHDDSGRQAIDPGEFVRGDSVWVEALISDGSEEVEARSDTVAIENAPARVEGIRFDPPQPTAGDVVEVKFQGGDADGDAVVWSYRWLVDGEELPGATSSRLAAGQLARGARVAVEISGNDGNEQGEWIASEEIAIANAAPKITTQPVYGLASPGRYVYEIKAQDADGDEALRYELAEGPAGMDVDASSGVLTWLVPPDAKGSFPIEIAVSDALGARAVQRWSLDVSWEEERERSADGAPSNAKPQAAPTDSQDEDELEAETVEPDDLEAPASTGDEDEFEGGDF
jgi:hypothetical protein